MLVIKNAQILAQSHASTQSEFEQADVLIDSSGKIVQIGPKIPEQIEAQTVDATGKILLPGFFDINVSLGQTESTGVREALFSVGNAAKKGGISGILVMPSTRPAIDSTANLRNVQEAFAEFSAQQKSPQFFASGCITKNCEGKELAAYNGLHASGIRLLTDFPQAIDNPSVLRRAMEYAGEMGFIFATYGDTKCLSNGGVVNEGVISYKLGLPGMPSCSEEMGIDRSIRLAHATGTSIHIQQVSTVLGVETIRWWKKLGAHVTAEVSLAHLFFTENDISKKSTFDTIFKINPPLRTESDQTALFEGLKDGTIDFITSAHQPVPAFEKEQAFQTSPFGMALLDTALLSLFDRLVLPGKLTWHDLVEKYSFAPRRWLGLPENRIEPGLAASELLLFDPNESTKIGATHFACTHNNPFLGETLRGKILPMSYLCDQ